MFAESLSRKDFIRQSSILLAGTTGFRLEEKSADMPLRLKNVRLEAGFVTEDGDITATRTELATLELRDGKITAILPNDPSGKGHDAKGALALPAFRDMHIHLDKTYYGDQWKARSAKNRSLRDMIAFEQRNLPELLKNSTFKAEKLIELLQSKGSTFARSHVNIEPTSGLRSLDHLEKALENKKDTFSAELVAFPQHGLYYTDSAGLMKEAATRKSIGFIGGLDPFAIDGSVEKPLDFVVQLALDHGKGIDIHLHEGGESGIRTVEYLIRKVEENPALKGKTYLSHCFVLGRLEKPKLEEIAQKLAAAGVGVISTIPFGGLIMPVPALQRHGVEVWTGNDSIVDHWNTFGSGSVLQKCNLMAQLYGYSTEFDLSRSLKIATGGILPLDDKGNRQWPKAGDRADIALVDATCSAEAVSRISPVKSVLHKGKLIF